MFTSIILVVIYLSVTLQGYDEAKIEVIELRGCFHLSEDQYYKSSNLEDKESYSELTLRIIKDRIEKHPYVESAEVQFESNGKVIVDITEKKFEAILIIDEKQFLLSENLQVLPLMLYTRSLDYPLIRNPKLEDEVRISEYLTMTKQPDLILADKIISTIRLINSGLYEVLSEIDLNNGKGITAYFSTMSYELRIGRNDVIKKIISYNMWRDKYREQRFDEILNYVDLRYDNHIFIGLPENALESWDDQS